MPGVVGLSPARRVAPVLVVAAAGGTKLTQILHIPFKHIAVTPAHPIRLRKVYQIFDRLVQLAGIELATRPSYFEFLQLLRRLVEVLSLMPVEIGARGSPVEVAQYAADERVLIASIVSSIAVASLGVSVLAV